MSRRRPNDLVGVAGERVAIWEGTLVLIPRGESHEIRNTGREALRTLNVCVSRRRNEEPQRCGDTEAERK
jgi:mannose-6-phosphate isomerase-like protein (cupin superfamily)